MLRILLIAIAVIAVGAPAAAQTVAVAPTPAPAKATLVMPPMPKIADAWGFSTRVHLPTGPVNTVSSAECNRRAVGVAPVADTMSLTGPTDSRTLVAVPVSGGNVANATTQQQITDICDRR